MAQEPQNLANAVVIIGSVFFMQSGFNWWLLALIVFGLATWAHWHETKHDKKIKELAIDQMEANIQNLKAATAIAIANTKMIMGKLGR